MNTFSTLSVVLVEPSRTQSRLIAGWFGSLGIGFHQCAHDGEQALEMFRCAMPDLVISAMYLPDMTGTDLLHAVRALDGGAATGFMLASSETSFAALDPIRQAGPSAVLPKPFTCEQLRYALNTCQDVADPQRLQLGDIDVEDIKVLVVDDSRLARNAIRRTLAAMGIENIVEAADGTEAIPLIEEHFFDIVFTDYNMPKMDGGALLDFIRTRSRQPSVPVLMVTTEGDVGKLSAVERLGVSAICDKPLEPMLLKRLIERSLLAAA